MRQQIARRPQVIQIMHKARRRALAGHRHHTRNRLDTGPILLHRVQKRDDRGLALAFQDTIDRAGGVLQHRVRDERAAVAAHAHEAAWQHGLGRLRQIHDLRHVGEVVARKGHDIRSPAGHHAVIRAMRLDLQIEQPALMARAPRRRGHQLEAKRFEAKEHFGVKQRTRMNEQDAHHGTSIA